MRRPPFTTAILGWSVVSCLLLSRPDAGAAQTAKIDPAVVSFLDSYCVRCHGPAEQNASLRFDSMPISLGDEATAQRWQDILDVLNLDEMPPEGEKRPSDDELSRTLETLTKNLGEARERLNDAGGKVVLRRLNRREYQNTVRELFGVDVSIDSVPDDAVVDGFDTNGTAHTFSSLHFERYLNTGATALDAFIGNRGPPKSEVRRFEPETFNRSVRSTLEKGKAQLKGLPDAGEVKPAPRGEIRRIDFQLLKRTLITDYLTHPASETGNLVPFRGLVPSFKSPKSVFGRNGIYKVRIRCGVDSPRPVDGVFLEVSRAPRQTKKIDRSDCFEVRGTVADPKVIEFEATVDGTIGNYLILARRTPRTDTLERFKLYAEQDPRYLARTAGEILKLADDEVPSVWIDWIETEGPFPQFDAAIDPAVVALHSSRSTEEDVRQMIEKVAFQAFRRRPPGDKFVDRLVEIYESLRENGADVDVATQECLKIALASPSFLFLYEPSPDGTKRQLTDRELAIRLSYFLWSGPPDEALYQAAESGELNTPRGLAKQLDRMLDSEKAEQFVVNFVTQFFELGRLGEINPEAASAPKYDRPLQEETKREVFAFFRLLLEENRPVYDMIDADYVVVNSLLADFYGIPGVRGDHFRMVSVPADSPRGGLLGQSAILTLTGTGERTSPVERGAYVLRKILNRPPPPAPANVPMLEEANLGNRSIRETLSVHMNKPQCSSCHRRIDPLGFGLENYDPVGLWRESVLSADGTERFSIEPAGFMPDGERQFSTPREMKTLMLEDRDVFLTGLTKAIMTYGLGRKVGYADQAEVDRIVTKTAAEGYGLRTLLHEIVHSEPFQTK